MKSSGLESVTMKGSEVNLCIEAVVIQIHFAGGMPLVEKDFALVVLDNHLFYKEYSTTVPSHLQNRRRHLAVATEDSRSSGSEMGLILPSAATKVIWGDNDSPSLILFSKWESFMSE